MIVAFVDLIGNCSVLKLLYTFDTEKKKKSSQIYKKLIGFTEGNGERLLLKYYSMKCFTFWENIKTIINSCCRELQIYFKHMSWHGENVRKQGWVPPLFSPDSDDRLSLNFHRFVIFYISCDTQSVGLWTVYWKCPMSLKYWCLIKYSRVCNLIPKTCSSKSCKF